MNSLKSFVITLALCIGFPTYVMVVRPYANERARQTIAYRSSPDPANPAAPTKDPEDLKGLSYPQSSAGDSKRGELVYAREGCAQCHTQVIRPSYAGVDQWKRGWGAEQEYKKEGYVPVRQTHPWDYMNEDFAMFGVRRVGPDLANAGYRYDADINRFYQHLYSPRSVHEWSNSPSFKHLFEYQVKERPEGRGDALKLPLNLLPEEGHEVVPTADAKALAAYILGLKRNQPLPYEISKIEPATPEK
jgi:cytochrome c oxidase cbb3-type subunit II